jgi:hypothetical protein
LPVRNSAFRSLAVLVLVAGCGAPPAPADGGLDADSGVVKTDAGSQSDAGTTTDAGTLSDAGTTTDAGTQNDAGTPTDAGTTTDAGLKPDAGTDAGVLIPDAGPVDAGCEISICLTGASARNDGSNLPFNTMCSAGFLPGLVLSTTFTTHETFLVNTANVIYPNLFKALDTNNDNKVDANDPDCKVNILGYSWGGVAAVELATAMTTDTRIIAARRSVHRLFAIDPFQPFQTLNVPAKVATFIEFRHTLVPAGDCSSAAPLGPYKGLQPHCTASTACTDYDYSLAPTTQFATQGGGSLSGAQVGHCEAAMVADPPIRAMFARQPLPTMPPTVPIIP